MTQILPLAVLCLLPQRPPALRNSTRLTRLDMDQPAVAKANFLPHWLAESETPAPVPRHRTTAQHNLRKAFVPAKG